MSMIGMFGVCPQSHYNKLANLLKSKDSGETEKLMQKIYSEVEASAEKLVPARFSQHCSTILKRLMESTSSAARKLSGKNGLLFPAIGMPWYSMKKNSFCHWKIRWILAGSNNSSMIFTRRITEIPDRLPGTFCSAISNAQGRSKS